MEGYGVLPRALRLIQQYWDCLAMMERSGGYYGTPFRSYWGLTKGYPLLPMLFNVSEDTVVQHWIFIVGEEATGP